MKNQRPFYIYCCGLIAGGTTVASSASHNPLWMIPCMVAAVIGCWFILKGE